MTSMPFFQVDAFADRPLTGNPAAVMPLERWLDDALMQAIAGENNLSETAFTVPSDRDDADFDLRWFTPAAEVEMCGHATIASGHILMTGSSVRFSTKSGPMTVSRRDDLLELDMRAATLIEVHEPNLCAALGLADSPVWLADGYNDAAIVEVADEAAVLATTPDFGALKHIHRMPVVTARGQSQSVVSRVFVPYLGIDEDPVTGSSVRFSTKSGPMTVSRRDDLLELDMRAARLTEVHEPQLCAALGLADSPVWLADGYNDAAIVEVADEAAVLAAAPDFGALKRIHRMAVVTARGQSQSVVSRVFVPYLGIDEDPVTGSAHAALVPYWTERLGRTEFTALQASARTGVLNCRQEGDRAVLGGHCQTVIVGQFQL
jgi:PhzF family phenazine biosynthesis protein